MATNPRNLSGRKIERVALHLTPRFNMMELSTTIKPMRVANYLSPENLFDWAMLSFNDSILSNDNGTQVACEISNVAEPYGLVMVFGS